MIKIHNITGLSKSLINLKIKLTVFFHYLILLFNGKLSVNRLIGLLRRLLVFLQLVQDNKFVTIGKLTKLDLYVPGFPSPSFFTACDKFKEFEQKMPCTTVLVSVTSGCKFDCKHCYQKMDIGKDLPLDILIKTVKKLQDMGMAFFNIEGGDPFLVYDRLYEVCNAIDDRSEIWINSTGDGMNLERLNQLKKNNLTAIMFSLHEPDEEALNQFMRNDHAWSTLVKGIELCHQTDIGVAINTCLSREAFTNGKFEEIMEKAKEFNACLVQIIVPKKSGAWLTADIEPFNDSDLAILKKKIQLYNQKRQYKKYPSISAQAIEEDNNHFGCTAGGTDRFYINAKGDVQPCEFLNLSFGNIIDEDFEIIYKRMRAVFQEPCQNIMCEKIAKKINENYNLKSVKILPLSVEDSEKIYTKWNRGKPTRFYQQIMKIK